MKIILIIIFTLTAINALAFREKLNVSASAGLGGTDFESERGDYEYEGAWGFGPSLTSKVSYRWNRWEIGFRSQVNAGKIENFQQVVQDSTIQGDVYYRGMSFGGAITYYTGYAPYKNWELYFSMGPHAQILTVDPVNDETQVTNGSFNRSNILKYEGPGGVVAIGFGKKNSKKVDWLFYQLTYKLIHYKKLTVVEDAGRETNVVHKSRLEEDFMSRSISFNVGVILF